MMPRIHQRFRILVFIAIAFVSACGKLVFDESKFSAYYQKYPYPSDPLEKAGIINAKKKSRQISDIEWTPLADIEGNTRIYRQGQKCKGIPYSSVKEMEKFVALNVSFRSFMSAVHNPRSVLYTENVGKPPYKGRNCSVFYGTVCSTTIAYALGWDLPYTTTMMSNLPFLEKITDDSLSALRPFDMLLYEGHVVLLDEIFFENNSDEIKYFRIMQSAGSDTFTTLFSPKELKSFMQNHQASVYRYTDFAKNQSYNSIPYVQNEGDIPVTVSYNEELCPDRGEESCYAKGELVEINVLDAKNYDLLAVTSSTGERLVFDMAPDIQMSGLSPGTYEARAQGKGGTSEPVRFCVVDTDVDVILNGLEVIVRFSSVNATPVGIILSRSDTSRFSMYELTDEQREAGYAVVPSPTGIPEFYCKVLFKNEFGSITNEPIHVLR